MLFLTKEELQEIIKHCQKEYPKEACGILAGNNGKASKVYKMANTSDNPQTCYFMEPGEQLKIFKEMRRLNLEMLGIYHSHSETEAYPSQRDCEMAFYPEASYIIISLQNFDKPEMHAFKIVEGNIKEEKIKSRKNILFVCIENSCRSQLAEAIVNNRYWRKFAAYSAGSEPSGKVNPLAVEVMKEIGIDISEQKSKGFNQVGDLEFDYVITLGCLPDGQTGGDECPIYPARQRRDWQIEDPKNKPIQFFRKVRDEIKRKIGGLRYA